MKYRRSAIVFAILSTFPIIALSDTAVMVSQYHRQFMPDTLEIPVGTVIHIENDDNVTHHVYVDSPDMKFDSGEQSVGHTVDLKFDHAGTFAVLCAIHPTMHLDVTVK